MNTAWHFPIMIVSSLLIFFVIVRVILGKTGFTEKRKKIFLLATVGIQLKNNAPDFAVFTPELPTLKMGEII
jgi:hypothetical protein